jgi:hypothetical protein
MTRVVVYHNGYGCDTGCCGHVVEMDGDREHFEFAHPYGDDPRKFAEDMVREQYGEEHVADLDWEDCFISDD